MNKVAALAATTLIITGTAAAQNIDTQFYPDQTTLQPGNTTTAGQLQVTAQNGSPSNIQPSTNFPFTTSFTPETRGGLNENQSLNFTLNANPSISTPPQEYTRTITVETDQTSGNTEISLSIPTLTRWETGINQFNGNLSVGSSGSLTSIPVNGTGNQDTQLDINASGNLTEYIDIREQVSVFPGVTSRIPVNYAVPRTTPFGFYNASVNVSGGNQQQTVQLSVQFLDEIAPEITSIEVGDVQATQNGQFRIEAEDNLDVTNVSAKILKEVTVREGNSTVQQNVTFEDTEFTQESENSQTWTYNFQDTDQEGQYHINISAVDGSGNTAHGFRSFTVNRLDVTSILNQNFAFEAVQPDGTAEQPVFENDVETPVNVTLERVTNSQPNSSFSVGLRKPGDEVAEKFDGETNTITVRESGVTQLVIESDAVQDYEGRLTLEPVPQAKDLPDIVFNGEFIDPVYPVPQNYSIGRFSGSVEYVDDEAAEKQRIRMVLEGSAEACKGFDRFEECINGFSLGEIPQLKEETQQKVSKATRERNLSVVAALLSWTVLGGYLLKERQAGLHTLVERVEIE